MDFDPEQDQKQFLPESNPTSRPIKEEIKEAKSNLDEAMKWLGENLNKIPDWAVITGILTIFVITIMISITEEK